MKSLSFFILLTLTLLVLIQSDTTIDFTSSGSGYTVTSNNITISTAGTYVLSGSQTNKKIMVSSASTLNLNSFSLINSGSLPPIVISSNQAVTMVLSGTSTLQDSSSNEKDGVIYLESGASLTISGTGTLNINPYKLMAINGTDGTSLTVSGGPTITVSSSSSSAGGIYLRDSITFNNAVYTYSCTSGTNHALDTEGDIKIIKGTYTLTPGNGKGIQAENNVYIGEESGDNSDLTLTITTSNEGIEAKGIEIYSGKITVNAEEDGINAAAAGSECDENVGCSGNCECYIKFTGGSLTLTSGEDGLDANGDIFISGGDIIVFAASSSENQPIDQDGLLSITGGNIIAAGSSSMGGISATDSQNHATYSGSISKGSAIEVINSSSNDILLSLEAPKEANYAYFSFPSAFTANLDGTQIATSTIGSSSNGGNSPIDPPGGSDSPNPNEPSTTSKATTSTDNTGSDTVEDTDDDPTVISTNQKYVKLSGIIGILLIILI